MRYQKKYIFHIEEQKIVNIPHFEFLLKKWKIIQFFRKIGKTILYICKKFQSKTFLFLWIFQKNFERTFCLQIYQSSFCQSWRIIFIHQTKKITNIKFDNCLESMDFKFEFTMQHFLILKINFVSDLNRVANFWFIFELSSRGF